MLWRGVVERLGWGGVGLARQADGRLIILRAPQALFPGEEVEADLAEHSRHSEGLVVRWLSRDPRRVEPECEYAECCGGCGLWGSAEWAAELKRGMVADLFSRQLRAFPQYSGPESWMWLPAPLGTRRSRIQLHWNGVQLGFMRPASNEIVPVKHCAMSEPVLCGAIPALERWLGGQPGSAGRWELATGTPSGDVMLTRSEHPGKAWRYDGATWKSDPAPLYHLLGGLRLRQSPGAFFQSSPRQAFCAFTELFEHWDTRGGTLYDIYGGGGFFSLMLRSRFGKAVLVENNPANCADARMNLAALDARIEVADAAEFVLSELAGNRLPAEDSVAILDPPRQGLPPALCEALLKWRPGKLVLIGCDGANFCRDASRLAKSWKLARLAALDLFPNTPHVECVGLFEQASQPSGSATYL